MLLPGCCDDKLNSNKSPLNKHFYRQKFCWNWSLPFRGYLFVYCTGKIRTNQKNLFYLLNCKYDNMYCRITFCKLFTLKHIQYSIHYCCKMLPLFVFENIFKLAPVGAFTFLHLYCFFFFKIYQEGNQKFYIMNILSGTRCKPSTVPDGVYPLNIYH